jgi:hypothetical protein
LNKQHDFARKSFLNEALILTEVKLFDPDQILPGGRYLDQGSMNALGHDTDAFSVQAFSALNFPR